MVGCTILATRNWHDHEKPHQDQFNPHNVKFLRIGFIQYQQLVEGNTSIAPIEVLACHLYSNLKQVQIYLPTVARIGNGAFEFLRHLDTVEFVMKPPRIEEGQEEEEQSISFPSQLASIGTKAFYRCRNLNQVTGLEHAAESLKDMGRGAFSTLKSLVNMNFLGKLTCLQSLGHQAFYNNSSVTNVDLSKAVHLKELCRETFHRCIALKVVILPCNLLRISQRSFCECPVLEYIQLPDKLQIIHWAAFKRCRKLKSIVLPSSLQQIGKSCFENCNNLSRVMLPSPRVPFLKQTLFNDSCKSLSSLELPYYVPRQEWPLILEQFCNEAGIANQYGGIEYPKNCNTIVWNFLCQNISQLFMEDNLASKRRPARTLRASA